MVKFNRVSTWKPREQYSFGHHKLFVPVDTFAVFRLWSMGVYQLVGTATHLDDIRHETGYYYRKLSKGTELKKFCPEMPGKGLRI